MGKKGENKTTGDLGESITCEFIAQSGYVVLERNYRTNFAEIDIIAEKEDVVHFIEVKTVSHGTKNDLIASVLRATWRPEEQVHLHKQHKISLGIEAWLQRNDYYGKWQIDIAAVRIVPRETYACVKMLENVVFS